MGRAPLWRPHGLHVGCLAGVLRVKGFGLRCRVQGFGGFKILGRSAVWKFHTRTSSGFDNDP